MSSIAVSLVSSERVEVEPERLGLDRGRLDVRRAHDQLAIGGLGRRDRLGRRAGAAAPCSAAAARRRRIAREAPPPARIAAASEPPREQQHAGEREEDGEDLRAGRAEQPRGGPQLGLAEDAAVAASACAQ